MGIEKDKPLPDIKNGTVMFKAGEMSKRKFMVTHTRTMHIVVFGCKPKKGVSKQTLAKRVGG